MPLSLVWIVSFFFRNVSILLCWKVLLSFCRMTLSFASLCCAASQAEIFHRQQSLDWVFPWVHCSIGMLILKCIFMYAKVWKRHLALCYAGVSLRGRLWRNGGLGHGYGNSCICNTGKQFAHCHSAWLLLVEAINIHWKYKTIGGYKSESDLLMYMVTMTLFAANGLIACIRNIKTLLSA